MCKWERGYHENRRGASREVKGRNGTRGRREHVQVRVSIGQTDAVC